MLIFGALLPVGCGGSDEAGTSNGTSEETIAASNVVVVRVSDTPGTVYTGAYGHFAEAQKVDASLGAEPTDYEVRTEGEDSEAVSAVFRKIQPADEGMLKAQILVNGEVVDQDETSAEFGVISVGWSPQQGGTTGSRLSER